MLETIREFASEQLDQLADAGVLRDRHAGFYVALGERARPELRARGAREWLERLDAEHANVRASLEHLLESGTRTVRCGCRGRSGCTGRHAVTGPRAGASDRRRRARVDLEPERLVDSLWGGALLALWQGDTDEGEQLASRLLEISKTAADQEHVYSVAIHLLAIVATRRGDRDQALAWLEESLALGRRGVTSGCSRSR